MRLVLVWRISPFRFVFDSSAPFPLFSCFFQAIFDPPRGVHNPFAARFSHRSPRVLNLFPLDLPITPPTPLHISFVSMLRKNCSVFSGFLLNVPLPSFLLGVPHLREPPPLFFPSFFFLFLCCSPFKVSFYFFLWLILFWLEPPAPYPASYIQRQPLPHRAHFSPPHLCRRFPTRPRLGCLSLQTLLGVTAGPPSFLAARHFAR